MSALPTAVTAALEVAINRVLALDEETLARLSSMQGKVIGIELRGLDVSLFLIPEINKLSVYGRFEGEPDTLLRGTPIALMRMGLVKHAGDVLFAGDVEISGDVELGQAFSEMLDDLDIDWEEHLSQLTGDLVAHKVGNVIRGAFAWGQQTLETLGKDAAEYLQEENDTLPNHDEVESFLAKVDSVRSDVDRMEARVRRLENKIKNNKSPQGNGESE